MPDSFRREPSFFASSIPASAGRAIYREPFPLKCVKFSYWARLLLARSLPKRLARICSLRAGITVQEETGKKLGVDQERKNIVRGIPAGGGSR
jgi:hypothetical protein